MSIADRLWNLSIITIRTAGGSLFTIHPALIHGERGFVIVPFGATPRGGRLMMTRMQLDAWTAGFTEAVGSRTELARSCRLRNDAAEFFGV